MARGRKPIDLEKKNKICELYQTTSVLDIAKELHVSVTTIDKTLRERGMQKRPNGINIGKRLRSKAEILNALNKYKTRKAAAKALKTNVVTVHRYMKKFSIKRIVDIHYE